MGSSCPRRHNRTQSEVSSVEPRRPARRSPSPPSRGRRARPEPNPQPRGRWSPFSSAIPSVPAYSATARLTMPGTSAPRCACRLVSKQFIPFVAVFDCYRFLVFVNVRTSQDRPSLGRCNVLGRGRKTNDSWGRGGGGCQGLAFHRRQRRVCGRLGSPACAATDGCFARRELGGEKVGTARATDPT